MLRGLRTGESHTLLGERFGVSRQAASRYFSQGLKVLIDNLVPEFLVIPTEDVVTARSSSDWAVAFGGDRIVLTADGTHFEIDVPEDNMLSWLTYSYYKGYNSQQTLLIVDSSRLIVGITGLMAGRAHELSHVWSSCGLNRVLEAFDGRCDVTLLADKAYVSFASFDHVTVQTPAKSKKQFTQEEKNQTRVLAKFRIYVEHVIGKLKNWAGLLCAAAMRFYEASDGAVGEALLGHRDERLFLAAALYNADLLGGTPLDENLGSAICVAPRLPVVKPDVVPLPTAASRRLNLIPQLQWGWLLPLFDVDVTRNKSNLLSKAWRSVLAGGVCGVRFGENGRGSLIVSVGAVVLPSMKQGVHYCYVNFTGATLQASLCSCKNGHAVALESERAATRDNVASCRHVLATCIALGLSQGAFTDVPVAASKWFRTKIAGRREAVNVRFVCSSECYWPPRVECLRMGLEDAHSVAQEARGIVAVHPHLLAGGWTRMDEVVREVSAALAASKQTLASLPFYALTHGPKKPELLAKLRELNIVAPPRATKEMLAWLIVQRKAVVEEDAQHMREVQRLTCVRCSIGYFDDEAAQSWICCSRRGCFQWNHIECEGVDQETVEREKKYACRACLVRPANADGDDAAAKDVFFDKDRNGPPSVSLDAALSDHHVLDCIRANRHVHLGDPVFPDDDEAAL